MFKSRRIDNNKHIWTIGQYDAEGPVPGPENNFNVDPSKLKTCISSQKGAYTTTNVEPFIEWWREYHLNSPADTEVLLDYAGETMAQHPNVHEFWTNFAVVVQEYHFTEQDLKPYYNIRDSKKPQSLNKLCFDKFGWAKQKVPDANTIAWIATVPAQAAPVLNVELRVAE